MKLRGIALSGVLGIVTCAIGATSFNPITAVTSASSRFKINSGNAYATYADINWWDYYNNGSQHVLRYGTTTAYGSTINLKPFTARTNITTRIPNLQPNTKYYIQFYRPYQGRDYMTNHTFTTAQAITAIPASRLDVALAPDLCDKLVEAFLPNGKIVSSIRIANRSSKVVLDRKTAAEMGLGCGAYIFVVKDPIRGTVLATIRKAIVG